MVAIKLKKLQIYSSMVIEKIATRDSYGQALVKIYENHKGISHKYSYDKAD